MAEKKSKKEKTNIVLPKAWQSMKHRNETAQAKTNHDDIWKAIATILLILFILFVILGGVSQTGVLKFIFNWSHNVGETVSNWFEGGSVVVNDDGVYYDPSGQRGDKIKDENVGEAVNIGDEIGNYGQTDGSGDVSEENQQDTDDANSQNGNSEVQEE
jgi:hypothetical protein